MTRHHHLRLHFGGTGQRLVEVVNFKPQEDSVAVWSVIRVADWQVMVVDLEAVQLHYQSAMVFKSFVFRTAVRAPATEEPLIPSAAGFDVGHCNEGLWLHRFLQFRSLN